MANYSAEDILRLRATAYRLTLVTSPTFWNRPIHEMIQICNGVGGRGSLWNPIFDFIYMKFHASTSIHDEGYEAGGTEADRLRIDKELHGNMIKQWKDGYNWFSRTFRPKVKAERRLIDAAYIAVRAGGSRYFNFNKEEKCKRKRN